MMIVKAFLNCIHKHFDCGNYETIRLVDIATAPEDVKSNKEFIAFTANALDLIRATDPRRYRILLREVRLIVNSRIMGGGQYMREFRRISVNFPLYNVDPVDERYKMYLAGYACILVHEATHGRLFSLGIPYNKRTWERCEGLCFLEEKRFISRLNAVTYDPQHLVEEVDAARYKSMRTPATKVRFLSRLFSRLFFAHKP
jgi:hypothetical protein